MSQVAKIPCSNGIKTNGATVEVEKVTTPVVQIPSVAKSAETKGQPLDERLHRLNQLFELQTKYNRLQSSKQNLAEFKLKKDSETITLTLSDYNSRGNDFTTKNPAVIKDLLEFLKDAINSKIKEIEALLKW